MSKAPLPIVYPLCWWPCKVLESIVACGGKRDSFAQIEVANF